MAIRNRLRNNWDDGICCTKVPAIHQIWKMSYSTHHTITIMSIKYFRIYAELWLDYIYKDKRFHVGRHVAYDLTYIIQFSQLWRWAAQSSYVGTHDRGTTPILIWTTVGRSLFKDITIILKVGFSLSIVLNYSCGIASAFYNPSRVCVFLRMVWLLPLDLYLLE